MTKGLMDEKKGVLVSPQMNALDVRDLESHPEENYLKRMNAMDIKWENGKADAEPCESKDGQEIRKTEDGNGQDTYRRNDSKDQEDSKGQEYSEASIGQYIYRRYDSKGEEDSKGQEDQEVSKGHEYSEASTGQYIYRRYDSKGRA